MVLVARNTSYCLQVTISINTSNKNFNFKSPFEWAFGLFRLCRLWS